MFSMDFVRLLHVQRPAYIIVFSVLICNLVDRSDCTSVSDLRIACGVRNKINTEYDVKIYELPNDCSSLLLCLGDFYDLDSLKDFLAKKPAIPIFLVVDNLEYSDWIEYFQLNPYSIKYYTDLIDNFKFDGLIFDSMYPWDVTQPMDDVISYGLPNFFKELKNYCTQKNVYTMFGIVLPGFDDALPSAFLYKTIDQYMDMYLVNSVAYYGRCRYGNPLSPLEYTKAIANLFYTEQLNDVTKSKVIFGMQLYVQDNQDNQLSYSEVCNRKSDGTIYCADSLKMMYQKGQIVNIGMFGGMYIRFINDDDVTGSCKCANSVKFPGFNAYVAGLNGQNIPDGYSDCTGFGLPDGY